MVQNKGLVFKQVPVGLPVAGKDLVVETREFDLEAAPLVNSHTSWCLKLADFSGLREELPRRIYMSPLILTNEVCSTFVCSNVI